MSVCGMYKTQSEVIMDYFLDEALLEAILAYHLGKAYTKVMLGIKEM